MRGSDEQNGALFSYVNLEDRVPTRHPLRLIRQVVNAALASGNRTTMLNLAKSLDRDNKRGCPID